MWFFNFFVILELYGLFLQISITITEQLNWTPIYSMSNNQIDLWTKQSNGCECVFNETRQDCACCVKPAGCQCGLLFPNKCAQCGLQQYCNNMCNVTIKASTIWPESQSLVGQIKSPPLQGPTECWYRLQPEAGYRAELQIYRVIDIGRFNGSGCISGHVRLSDENTANISGVEICGENERFSPPVVIFVDKTIAILTLRVDEKTSRSQFLAYYSFTPNNNTQGVGFRPRGGKQMENTACDWLYQDFSCKTSKEGCVLASPGYPGLYKSKATCRYHITMSSLRTQAHITFSILSLPLNRCGTDYINIYQGTSSTANVLATICSNSAKEFVFSGPNILLEFKSGPSVPPYDYNGFVASLKFSEDNQTTTQTSLQVNTIKNTINTLQIQNRKSAQKKTSENIVDIHYDAPTSSEKQCQRFIYGNITRSGHFDTRSLPWNYNCTLIFIGQSTDLVHISFFNYKLIAPSCQSYIDVLDGNLLTKMFKPVNRLCSPITKFARDSEGRFHEQQTYLSTGTHMSILFRRFQQLQSTELEYVDGAFSFLDEYAEGTLKPNALCDVNYFGENSSPTGRVYNPGSQHLFWNVEGPLRCSQKFIPALNQSITLKVDSLHRLQSDKCHTECGDNGCFCVTNNNGQTVNYDHLLIINSYGGILSCLCGNFQEQWLPVTVRSWSSISVIYSLTKYSWAEKGFTFEAEYKFTYDGACGHRVIDRDTGEITSVNVREGGHLNYYFNQICTWVLQSKNDRRLSLEITATQNRPCRAWNISISQYSEIDNTKNTLHVFCSRDKNKMYDLPWKTNQVLIKLTAMTRTLPQFVIRWKSHEMGPNTYQSYLPPTGTSTSITINYKNYYYVLSCAIFCVMMIINQ